MKAFNSGRAEHEPTVTDRLITNMENALDGREFNGVRWQAKTLTSAGAQSQESILGADLLGVLNLTLPNFKVTKGFLAQAKRLEPGANLTKQDAKRLFEQCEKMLDHTPMSYVFIYSQQCGIQVTTALNVLSAKCSNPLSLEKMNLRRFFRLHLQCMIGDRRLKAASIDQLKALQEEVQSPSAILMSGHHSDSVAADAYTD